MKTVTMLATLGLVIASATHRMHPLSDEFIDFINSNQTLWIAGRNFHRHTPLKYLKSLTGTIKVNSTTDSAFKRKPPRYNHIKRLPKFDARKEWKYCKTLYDIRDQGACGSCWAVSAASAMTDRLCIQSQGSKNHYFSEFDIMSCCMNCGSPCAVGGDVQKAWTYGSRSGIVSGGKFNSHKGCKPYPISPCEHNNPYQGERKKCNVFSPKYVCKRKCEPGFNNTYTRDRIKLRFSYDLTDVDQIMADIQIYGPVTTAFTVYEDFFSYKSGIYYYVTGKEVGYHAVKLLGWGEENGVPYWLAANSWNTDWGDKGFFKILRGKNELGIEDAAHGGSFIKKPKRHAEKISGNRNTKHTSTLNNNIIKDLSVKPYFWVVNVL